MGDFYHTDHVHGFTPNSEYECYDRDVTDHVGKWKPDFFPTPIPAPLAYYFMDEGSGYNLTDSVSGDTTAGSVMHVKEHQLTPGNETHPEPQPGADHSGPNWQADEYFGSSIACGKIDDTIIQKDTLNLADVVRLERHSNLRPTTICRSRLILCLPLVLKRTTARPAAGRGASGSATRRASTSPTTSVSSFLATATPDSLRPPSTKCTSR